MEIVTYIIYGAIALILGGGLVCYVINQKKSIKEWLLFAVVEAEKALGSKTGKLKLRQVFENFIKLYPFFSKFIKFETFSKWVDKALEEMKKMLQSNVEVQGYVGVKEDVKGDE